MTNPENQPILASTQIENPFDNNSEGVIDHNPSQSAAEVFELRVAVQLEGKKTPEVKDKFAKVKKTATVAMVVFGGLSQVSGMEKIKPEGGITFLPQPGVSQTIEEKRIEVSEQFKLAKSTGIDRVAVQFPNNSTEEKTLEFLRMVKDEAVKNKISVSGWGSNWIGGSKIPFNHITMELIKKHPNWFLHSEDSKIMIGQESGARHVYPNPLNLELSEYVDNKLRLYSGTLGAKGIVVDDLALPIDWQQIDGSVEFKAPIGVDNAPQNKIDSRPDIYKKKLEVLKSFTTQTGIPLSISSQNNTDSTNFYAFYEARAIGADEIIPQIYAQGNPRLFDSQLNRTLNELNKTDRGIKVTPVLFAGNNSVEAIQQMSLDARSILGSRDVGVFPIAGISKLAKKDPKSVKNIFRP
jgi:hypothetical protein